jgi:putative ABC transport system permease protein
MMRFRILATLWLACIGIASGVPAGLLGARAISSMLFGLGPSDPMTVALATMVMVAVTVLAAYLPARRAALLDPLLALRYE